MNAELLLAESQNSQLSFHWTPPLVTLTKPARVRVAVFGSFYGGFHLLQELLGPDLSDIVQVVGVATDDPRQPFVHPDVRLWKYPHTRAEELLVSLLRRLCGAVPSHPDSGKRERGDRPSNHLAANRGDDSSADASSRNNGMKNRNTTRAPVSMGAVVARFDQMAECCSRIITIAALLEAAGDADLLDAGVVGQAGRLVREEAEKIAKVLRSESLFKGG